MHIIPGSDRASPFSDPPHYTILIYGATSYTGLVLIQYLLSHPQLNPTAVNPAKGKFNFALAARNEGKLRKLREETGLGDTDLVVCELGEGEEEGIKKMVELCDVVINLAGPYLLHHAEMIVKACASSGKHYVDLTGETPFVSRMIKKYDYLASQTGACVVPSCGFDSVPSDLTTYLSAKHLATTSSSQTANITSSQSFFWVKVGLSGGSAASLFAIADLSEDEKKAIMTQGEFCLAKKVEGSQPSPGFRIHSYNASLQTHGGFWIMASHNVSIVRRSWSLFQSPPPGVILSAGPQISYGLKYRYSEALALGRRCGRGSMIGSWVSGFTIGLFVGLFMSSRIVRWLAKKVLPDAGEGPSEKALMNGYMDVVNISETDDRPPRKVVTRMSGESDPGYHLTLAMLAESALALTLDHDRLPPMGKEGGVLTPATAMGDVLVERLVKSEKIHVETMNHEEWVKRREWENQVNQRGAFEKQRLYVIQYSNS